MATLEQGFTLGVGSRTSNLVLIREFVTHVGRAAGLDPADVDKLELAVDEACSNVIEHAYGFASDKQVIVRAVFDEEQLMIEIVDEGHGFDPSEKRENDLAQLVAERKTGGLGLRLINSLMDEVHYEVEPGKKNELRMVLKLKKPSSP